MKPGDLVCFNVDVLNKAQQELFNLEGVFLLLSLPSIGNKLDIATILAADQIFPTHLRWLKKYETLK